MTFKYPVSKVLYELIDQLKSSFFFILIVYILNYSNDSTFMVGLKIVYAGVLAIAIFGRLSDTFFTKVQFAADGVRMYTGVFSKSERFIPREKFENVQTSTTVLQRLFRVQKVVMETGDAAGDVTLTFVKAEQVDKMKAYVLSSHTENTIVMNGEEQRDILF